MNDRARGSIVTFVGKSGRRYSFQASPLDPETPADGGGVYIFTRRECLDRTFPSKGSHRCLAIGRTTSFTDALLAKDDVKKAAARGANYMCVYRLDHAALQMEVEQDLIDGNEQWGTSVSFLSSPDVPPRPPGGEAHPGQRDEVKG